MIHARSSFHGPRWLGLAVFAAAISGAAATLTGCSSTPDTLVLGLNYTPTSAPDPARLQGVAGIPATMRVWINPIVDRHPEGSQIGLSKEEDDTPVYFGAQGLPPADFVRAALVQVLPAYAVPVSPDSVNHTHVLQLTMSRFWTLEGNTYEATITALAVLADRNGNTLWQAEISGANKRWGRSFQPEAYLQVFSDAALDLGARLARDPGFRAAMAAGG